MLANPYAAAVELLPPKHKNIVTTAIRYYGMAKCCLGCCCGLFKCFVACALNLVCQILCVLLVLAAVAFFILWLLFRPSNLEFHASNASLSEFILDGSTLRYDLAFDISARNPNSRLEIIYKDIDALAFYQDQKFADDELPRFSQETNSAREIRAEFKGQNIVTLGDEARANYDQERSLGEFAIDLKVQLVIRLKLWLLPSPFFLEPSFNCELNVPLNSSGKPFQGTDCAFDWHKLIQ